jgi:hypothetical protein
MFCARCGGPIGQDGGPADGWQLDNGMTVCNQCCVKDLHQWLRARTRHHLILFKYAESLADRIKARITSPASAPPAPDQD